MIILGRFEIGPAVFLIFFPVWRRIRKEASYLNLGTNDAKKEGKNGGTAVLKLKKEKEERFDGRIFLYVENQAFADGLHRAAFSYVAQNLDICQVA